MCSTNINQICCDVDRNLCCDRGGNSTCTCNAASLAAGIIVLIVILAVTGCICSGLFYRRYRYGAFYGTPVPVLVQARPNVVYANAGQPIYANGQVMYAQPGQQIAYASQPNPAYGAQPTYAAQPQYTTTPQYATQTQPQYAQQAPPGYTQQQTQYAQFSQQEGQTNTQVKATAAPSAPPAY